MDQAATPEGAIRIGMAHGSIQGFGSEGEASNYVSPSRANDAGLSYLAMGDWHRQMKVNDRCWYSGTPEPDQFKLPPNAVTSLCNGGSALLVEINGSEMVPAVSPIPTGRYHWHRLEKTLTEDTQIDLLESELRALDPDQVKSSSISGLRAPCHSRDVGRLRREFFRASVLRYGVCALTKRGLLLIRPTKISMKSITRGLCAWPRTASRRSRQTCQTKARRVWRRLL